MANLTEISIGIRKIATYLGIGLIVIVILRFMVGVGITYYKLTHQPPPALPDIAFGKLPRPKFPDNSILSAEFTFNLQNIEGRPPDATAAARVFSMPKKSYTFESGEEIKQLAKKM